MRISRCVLGVFIGAAALGACFDEGGDTHQTLAAKATADGLMAFADINNNLTTDAGAAGAALAKFLATPIAAHDLVSPPFTFQGATTIESPRIAAPALGELPGCVTTSGLGGCDSFTTVGDGCAAGNFEFQGGGSRMCPGCPDMPDTLGACKYDWNLDLTFTTPIVKLTLDNTTGTETVSANEITANLRFPYKLTADTAAFEGDIEVCGCGPLTIDNGPPRVLVHGEFVVKDHLADPSIERCAQVTFTNNEPTSVLQCSCSDGSTCRN